MAFKTGLIAYFRLGVIRDLGVEIWLEVVHIREDCETFSSDAEHPDGSDLV